MNAASQLTEQTTRRSRKRWEFTRELRFFYRQGNRLFVGSGRTKDLSEDGVCFENDHQLPGGAEIELRISWPVLLQNVCPLELVIRGPLVRTDRRGSVVHVAYCEFQTFGERSFKNGAGVASCSVVG